jgi:signal transduction histidine kinase/DNA-binding response OmpR family regulator
METDYQATVLLVDDRSENLLAMETILADLGQNLVRANSAREALRYLLVNDVALILLDVQMPMVNGFELAELIRERERTQHTPIIFISATSKDEQYIFKGYSLGAVDYLTKPFDAEILKSKVRFFTRLFRQHQEIKRQAALLEQTNAQLDTLNCELEERVHRRTLQLEKANDELEKEIAVRNMSEARLATEHAITVVLAGARDMESATPAILQAFRDHLNADFCSLWLLNETGDELTISHIETSGNIESIELFLAQCRKLSLPRGKGLPGQVWQKNAPVWIPSTAQGANFPRAKYAAAVGLNSAVAFPINIAAEFYGVIEFFTRRTLSEDQQMINMLKAVGSEIGQFAHRKRVEAERENLLRREKTLREQAERANHLKDEFLATVSHELRTPLNAILGWGKILSRGGLDEETQSGAWDAIYRNARSQAQLIEDLLDTSRLITGNLRLNLTSTPTIPLIEAAIDVVRPNAEAKGITLLTSYDTDIDAIVCDTQRLQQILWNLLTNAIKFTPGGGSVTVSLRHNDSTVKIVIKDTGIGISPEFLPYVFDQFRQADSSSTRRHDGLGLGLAIVRHLAELHGGTVTVTSEGQGKGSAFTVEMPVLSASVPLVEHLEAERAAEVKEAPALGSELNGLRVLLVDDDTDTCEMLTFALNLLGADTQSSTSVSDAFVSLAERVPDVLLADINMPGEDGYSLIAKLRALSPEQGSNIPAIAITAMARPEDGEKVIMAGFQAHLPKPIDIEELSAAIANLTKNREVKVAP